ncbi:hypothetical protein CGC21_4690 [Leishmania donovani]|uniref:Uncharacterized protein n=1 Tax=Leishmania donovani TaxID=5661 RepID=A0A504XG40_LEIDO|nr:hypothetical protein CGC21_4690 [Leishmania donovani]
MQRCTRNSSAHASFERSNVDRGFLFQVAGAADAVPPCVTVDVDQGLVWCMENQTCDLDEAEIRRQTPCSYYPVWGASGCRSATPFLLIFNSFFDLPAAAP